MTTFNYIALDPQQKRKKGVVEADSPRQARQQLRDQNLMPLEVRIVAERKQSRRWIRFSLRRKWSTADLVLVTRQMATLLNSDIPVDELLKAVSEQAEKPQVKQILLGLRAKVLEGYTLAENGIGCNGEQLYVYRSMVLVTQHMLIVCLQTSMSV